MPHRNDLYGFSDLTLEEAKVHVESALGLTLALRDSSYSGLYYAGVDGRRRSFQLFENDEAHGGLCAYPDHRVILALSDVGLTGEIEEKLLSGGRATLLRTQVLPDDDEELVEEDCDPSIPHRRYDLYGFRTMSLDEAKEFVEGALGVAFEWDRSSTWGSGGFYCVRKDDAWDYLLYRNTGDRPEHPRYREFGVILAVEEVPGMDEIQRKLTEGRTDPRHLHTQRVAIPEDSE